MNRLLLSQAFEAQDAESVQAEIPHMDEVERKLFEEGSVDFHGFASVRFDDGIVTNLPRFWNILATKFPFALQKHKRNGDAATILQLNAHDLHQPQTFGRALGGYLQFLDRHREGGIEGLFTAHDWRRLLLYGRSDVQREEQKAGRKLRHDEIMSRLRGSTAEACMITLFRDMIQRFKRGSSPENIDVLEDPSQSVTRLQRGFYLRMLRTHNFYVGHWHREDAKQREYDAAVLSRDDTIILCDATSSRNSLSKKLCDVQRTALVTLLNHPRRGTGYRMPELHALFDADAFSVSHESPLQTVITLPYFSQVQKIAEKVHHLLRRVRMV